MSYHSFDRFASYSTEIDRVLHLCISGLQAISATGWLLDSSPSQDGNPDLPGPAPQEDGREFLRRQGAFARLEVEQGYPVLHAHAIVALWGALEVLIGDLVIERLRQKPALLTNNTFTAVRISLGMYESLDQEERLRYLLGEVQRKLALETKSGASRFEVLLDSVGLGGVLNDNLRRTLFEMQQIRNVLVHRNGVVDRRLCDSCPWLTLQRGERLSMSASSYHRYREAATDYFHLLIQRITTPSGSEEHNELFFARGAGLPVVRAAGGVVYRILDDCYMTVLVGNEGKTTVWRLPKGMVNLGEGLSDAALREVREEAGVAAEIKEQLGVASWEYEFGGITYRKETTFFLMHYVGDDAEGRGQEYELVSWVPLSEALDIIYYASERDILTKAMRALRDLER